MKHTLLIILALILSAPLRATTIDQVPNVQLTDSTHFVSNPDGILSPTTVDSIDATLRHLRSATSCEAVVVALRSIPPDIEPIQFATELGQQWGVGKSDRDNGIVILLVTSTHRMAIATGRGTEGPLPDALAGRIIRDIAIPYFRRDDYSAGTLAAVRAVTAALTDPQYRRELMSDTHGHGDSNDSSDDSDDDFAPILWMFSLGAIALAILLTLITISWHRHRRDPDPIRYARLADLKPVALFLSFLGLGIPIPAYILCTHLMNRVRSHTHPCPNCGTHMDKLDEQTDNLHLTPAQDREEQLGSVDYDVWLCPRCGEKDIIPYLNPRSTLTPCPHCHARTAQLTGTRITTPPTSTRTGTGIRTYTCLNCRATSKTPYTIPRQATPVVIIPPGGGRSSGPFGGGGSIGGGFGGGSFGGGGASGSW